MPLNVSEKLIPLATWTRAAGEMSGDVNAKRTSQLCGKCQRLLEPPDYTPYNCLLSRQEEHQQMLYPAKRHPPEP